MQRDIRKFKRLMLSASGQIVVATLFILLAKAGITSEIITTFAAVVAITGGITLVIAGFWGLIVEIEIFGHR